MVATAPLSPLPTAGVSPAEEEMQELRMALMRTYIRGKGSKSVLGPAFQLLDCMSDRYSLYLLYWYKSTNTDAECMYTCISGDGCDALSGCGRSALPTRR